MNVLDILDKELKDLGQNWSLAEKSRYIYLRSCELFTYDPRYDFCPFITNGQELEREINNREFDLENINDNRVVCHTYINDVLSEMLNQLLGLKVLIRGRGHKWLVFNDGQNQLNADGTLSNDLARVKMHLNTLGYKSIIKNYNFNALLQQMDRRIGYINDQYQNIYIKNKAQKLLIDFSEQYNSFITNDVNTFDDQFLIYKLYTIKEIFESYSNLEGFKDCEFCINYLLRKFLSDTEFSKIQIDSLFMCNENQWDYVIVYTVALFNEDIYFVCKKGKKGYDFYKIPYSEVKEIYKSYKGTNRFLLIK